MRRGAIAACLLAAALTVCATPRGWAEGSDGADEHCRLALVLALDVSSSVDALEYDLQRVGLAAALSAEEVRHAILSGAPGYVALSVFEWSGFHQHKLQLDWMALRSHADIDHASGVLAQMARSHDDFPTSIGPALGYGATLLERGPRCERRVIDVSGDGVNNYRYGPREAYRHFPFSDVTVNGLVILGDDPAVATYYATEVLQGTGAFLVVAQGFEEFREAMTRKLYREINDVILGAPAGARPLFERPRG
ncbi:MAG: DUF1194 domain-containing protein [Roseovarius sp.]